jgi:GntR family transcriptional regulator
MDLDLDPTAPEPLFRQLADGIRRLIGLGALRAGERLPTVRELAATARVNRNTAARAIQRLEAEGLVRTRVGSGTHVTDEAADRVTGEGRRRLQQAIDALIETAEAAAVPLSDLPTRVAERMASLGKAPAPPHPSTPQGPSRDEEDT